MSDIYTAKVTVIGGRSGHAESDDGQLKLHLTPPGHGNGTNPEQLFAAGYAACFESALQHVAKGKKITLRETSVHATVVLHSSTERGFYLTVTLKIEVSGVDESTAKELVTTAHTVCPYSKAIHGNVEVKLNTIAIP